MHLNADILHAELEQVFPAELFGYHTGELNLRRPEFYTDPAEPLRANHLYLLPGDQLPRRLKVEKGAVLLCAGNPPMLQPYLDRLCVLRLRDKADPFALMNAVTAIYDKYGRWYEQLHQIVETTADLGEMAAITSRLFHNPVMVLDSEFRFVTTAGYDSDEARAIAFDENGTEKLSVNALNQFLSEMDLQIDKTDPLRIDIGGHSVLSYNLFDSEEYAGSLTVEYRNRGYRPGDEPLIRLFAHYLMLAMKQHSQFLSSNHSVLRKTLRDLLDERPVDPENRRRIAQMEAQNAWRCLVLQPGERLSQVPVSYVCEELEQRFPGSVAFSYGASIVAFLSTDTLDNSAEARRGLVTLLDEQFSDNALKVGIGSAFSDLFDARMYYAQALIALEDGAIFDPDETYYFFEGYALEELVINALGDQPLDLYYSDGLKRLFAHDAQSPTSYLETLRVYLNNNMNVTATAADLYVHRSTLLERLSHIKDELGDDLKDPDVRLRLLILLKALELQEGAGLRA